jgi:integrase
MRTSIGSFKRQKAVRPIHLQPGQKKITRDAAIPKHVTLHVFRHTFATLLLENDVDIKYIQLYTVPTRPQLDHHHPGLHPGQPRKTKQILTDKHP